jgi:hypothetical protein
MKPNSISIYIEPQSHHFLGDRLFALESAKFCGDNILAPFIHLRNFFVERGVPVHTSDRLPESRADLNIYVSLGMRKGYGALLNRPDVHLSAFFAIECPIAEPALYRALPELQRHYRRIFSWSDAEALSPLAGPGLELHRFFHPQSFDSVHEALWSRRGRRFLVMINSNKRAALAWRELYTERLRAIDYFGRSAEIDLYGKGWDRPAIHLSYAGVPRIAQRALNWAEARWASAFPDPLLSTARSVWKGVAESKSETLSRYKFALCFENTALRGYVTEKIFDCIFAGTVPIYMGAPDIAEHVPAEAFIDLRRFASYADLKKYLVSLDDAEWERMREAGRDFVASDAFHPFSSQAFLDIFRKIVAEDVGLSL